MPAHGLLPAEAVDLVTKGQAEAAVFDSTTVNPGGGLQQVGGIPLLLPAPIGGQAGLGRKGQGRAGLALDWWALLCACTGRQHSLHACTMHACTTHACMPPYGGALSCGFQHGTSTHSTPLLHCLRSRHRCQEGQHPAG